MQRTFSPDGRWRSVVSRVAEAVDLETTARRFGALRRVRKFRSASDLLWLALFYGPAGLLLRSAALAACEAGVAASLSDKAVLGRLRLMGDWLAHILEQLLAGIGQQLGGDLALVDGTVVFSSGPGKPGFRVHALYEPSLGRFTDFKVTTDRVREAARLTQLSPGRTMLFDRGYARVRNIADVLAAGSDLVTRIGWRSLPLRDAAGAAFDLFGALPEDAAVLDRPVYLPGIAAPLRLVAARLPATAQAAAQKRVRRRASKVGKRMDPRTATAASYLMLVTSLPAERCPADQVLQLYRGRWQVELGFKRLKSLGGLDALRAADPDVARTWLLAHLIGAVLTEEFASRIAGFSPLCHARQAVCRQSRSAPLAGLADRASPPARRHSAAAAALPPAHHPTLAAPHPRATAATRLASHGPRPPLTSRLWGEAPPGGNPARISAAC